MIDLGFLKKEQTDRSIEYIKAHRIELISRFASDDICPPEIDQSPISIFMAGSPGAGKTEYSKSLITETGIDIVRIDPDEIRNFFPWYVGNNSDEVQHGAFRGVDKLYDYVIEKKKNALIDGTFTPYLQAVKNVRRSLEHNRTVKIYYLYQDAIKAWEYTKLRAIEEGRSVPKNVFIESLFEARENIVKVKDEFGKSVSLLVIKNDYTKGAEGLQKIGINEIDEKMLIPYNKEELARLLT